jgi:tetratricopeptide (TPR) repeat protein
MASAYDIFLSHAWADGDFPHRIAEALTQAGLRVWFDVHEISDYASITRAVIDGLAQSKALLAYYSKTYPLRRACQWELTAAFLAAQSEGDPRLRVLIVNPEPNDAHIHPLVLRDAKFRAAPGVDNSALEAFAQSIAKQMASLDSPLAGIHPLAPPNWYGTTPVGSTRFVGRLVEMWELHSLLHRGDVTQISGASVVTGGIGQVSGLGGVGKSLLAEEYAIRFGAAYSGGIFWLRAYGNDDAKSALAPEAREAERIGQVQAIAERFGITTQGLTPAQIEGALARAIAQHGQPCLWVVDDVPNGLNGDALRRWFAPHPLARTLITTRSREYGSLAKGIDLSVLAAQEAYQLITSRRQPSDEAEQEHARSLAADLGCHALALDITASALASSVAPQPFANFRDKLAQPSKDAMTLAETLSDALPNGHEKSIAQTILRSVHSVGPAGADFLSLASVLAVAPIPASMVTAVFQEASNLSPSDAEERTTLAFQQITSASLAEPADQRQDARAVHTLVSRTIRFQEKDSPARAEFLRAAAIRTLAVVISRAAEDSRLHKQIELEIAHARHLVSIPTNVHEASLIGWLARYDLSRGACASAKGPLERELQFRLRVQGPEDPSTLISMSNLAEALFECGDLVGARKLQVKTLEIDRRVLGPEHDSTLISISNLAATLYRQGDFAGARKLQQETLEFRRRILGREHSSTLIAMNNLAATLSAEGDPAGASKLLQETLEIRRRVLGPEDLNTLIAMNNLAETLSLQGDLSGARKLQEEALAILRRLYGPENHTTLTSMNNLARTIFRQGDLNSARKMQEETLEIRRRTQGLEHSDTSISAWNLFLTLQNLGHVKAARAVVQRDLRWLLDRDPSTLGADQRNLRERVANWVKANP